MSQWVALSLIGATLIGCQALSRGNLLESSRTSTLDKPIRVGSYFWPSSFWVDVAWKKGWFKEAGLNVERVDINADYFKAFDDLVDGKLDSMAFALFDFILYNARGKHLAGVVHTDVSYGADALVARPGIRTTRDLIGKTVGLPQGTYLDFMFEIIARRDALDLSKIHIQNIRAEDADKELAKGKLTAVMAWEPVASNAVSAVKGKRLFTTADLPGVCGDVCAFRQSFVDDHPEEVQRYVNVWHRASDFIKAHPEEAYAIVAEINKKPIAEVKKLASLDKLLDLSDNKLAFSYASGFESLHGTWRQMNDFMLDKGLVKDRLDSTKFLDSRFLLGAE